MTRATKMKSTELSAGMRLAQAVTAGDVVLLERGEVLTDQYIARIQKRHVRSVWVEQDEINDFIRQQGSIAESPREQFKNSILSALDFDYTREQPEPIIQEKVEENPFLTAYQTIYSADLEKFSQILTNLQKGQTVDETEIDLIVSDMLFQVRNSPRESFQLVKNQTLFNYILAHSLNVAYLSIILGHLAGMSEEELNLLGQAALLHDVGMTKLETPIWNSPRSLSELERFDVEKHTVHGIDLITENTNLKKEVGYVAYAHHERIDGTGYPKMKQGNLISEMTQIVSVCDVFSAMTSNRAYRQKRSYSDALRYFLSTDTAGFNNFYSSLLADFITREIDSTILEDVIEVHHEEPPKKVVLVDNDPDVVSLILSNTLKRHNFDVQSANSVTELVSRLSKQKPDLLIFNLKSAEDFKLCEKIKQSPSYKDLPVIVISLSTMSFPEKQKHVDLVSYLSMPLSIVDMLDRVKRMLMTKKLHH